MDSPEKFDLAEMLAEIETDKAAETPENNQHTNISQSVIMTLIEERGGNKGSATDD